MCIFTSEWPQVGTMGVFKASQTLQWFFTDTWDWLFFMNYLIETKETFSAPTSATNKTVPLRWISKYVNQWKPPPRRRKHARKKKKYSETHCVQTDLLGHFLEADFKERVETRMEIRKTPQWLLLHLTTHAVILKLKIVFNLCLCSFSKEHGTEQQKPQQLQYQRWGFLTPFVSVHYLLLPG